MTHIACLSFTAESIEYIDQQEEATPAILMRLIKWRKVAAHNHLSSKQTKMHQDLQMNNFISHFLKSIGSAHHK